MSNINTINNGFIKFEAIPFEKLLYRILDFKNLYCVCIAYSSIHKHEICRNFSVHKYIGFDSHKGPLSLSFVFVVSSENRIDLEIRFEDSYELNISIELYLGKIKEITGDYAEILEIYNREAKYLNLDLRLEIINEQIFNFEIKKRNVFTNDLPIEAFGLIFKHWQFRRRHSDFGDENHGCYIIGSSAYNYLRKNRPLTYTVNPNNDVVYKQHKSLKGGVVTFEDLAYIREWDDTFNQRHSENLFPSFFCNDRNVFIWRTIFQHFFMNKKYLCTNYDEIPNISQYKSPYVNNPNFRYKIIAPPDFISCECFILSQAHIGDDLF
jgi:hypothetical protein